MNKIKLYFLLLLCASCYTVKTEQPLINAHAHNDYEHEKPLLDALENKFISVEADVHLINDELYVSHFTPKKLDSTKTLELLYLKPLLARINKNKGNVYKGYDGFFYLMIDIKTDAEQSYNKLKEILKKYQAITSLFINGKEETDKQVKLVITGHKGRPYNQILNEEPKVATIDGRLKELDKEIPSAIMPYISENYNNYLSYSGKGNPSEKDKKTIKELVSKVHKEGKKLRFWASPDNQSVWDFLLSNQVDLVNTDSLVQFKNYISSKRK